MRNTIKILLLFGVIVFTAFSCDKDEENEPIEKQLIGTWIENFPCNGVLCDTIVFYEDNTIGLFFPFEGWSYNLQSNDSIVFINQSGLTQGFDFKILEKNTLYIYDFDDGTIFSVIKNYKFIKQ